MHSCGTCCLSMFFPSSGTVAEGIPLHHQDVQCPLYVKCEELTSRAVCDIPDDRPNQPGGLG